MIHPKQYLPCWSDLWVFLEFVRSDSQSQTLIRSDNFATYESLEDFTVEFRVRFESSQRINLLSKWRFQRSDHWTKLTRAYHPQNLVFFALRFVATRFNYLDSTNHNHELCAYLLHVVAEIADSNAQFASYSFLIDVSLPSLGAHSERDPSPNCVSSE